MSQRAERNGGLTAPLQRTITATTAAAAASRQRSEHASNKSIYIITRALTQNAASRAVSIVCRASKRRDARVLPSFGLRCVPRARHHPLTHTNTHTRAAGSHRTAPSSWSLPSRNVARICKILPIVLHSSRGGRGQPPIGRLCYRVWRPSPSSCHRVSRVRARSKRDRSSVASCVRSVPRPP